MKRHPGEPLWLEEKKAQRVSYHEATIFALRQAGIHVEPHWFGPVEYASSTTLGLEIADIIRSLTCTVHWL